MWYEAPVATAFHIAALVLGVVALDIGSQMIQVANQTRVFGLDPSARSRLNTVYMTIYFTGAAVGSASATMAWVHWKWNGVCGLAIGFVGLAAVRHITGRRDGTPGGLPLNRPLGRNLSEEDRATACLEA